MKPDIALRAVSWRRSSYSLANNDCVEVAAGLPGAVPVRDSKVLGGPILVVSGSAWRVFVDGL